MGNHWYNAQEEARKRSGANIVFSQDSEGRDVALVGNPLKGWRLVVSQGIVEANTAHAVEGVFEEFNIPFQDWH